MSGPCDDELYSSHYVNSTYTACHFIHDHLEDCTGESIINYRIFYFCLMNQNLYIAAPVGVSFIWVLQSHR